MRLFFCLWLLLGAAFAEDLPLLGLAHVGFRVSDIEKARAFYHGVLGYDEAFDLKAPDGHVAIAYFKVNDNQFLEVFPGIPPGTTVMMSHIAMYTDDIEKLHKMIKDRGLDPGKINEAAKDGNRSFAIRKPPGQSLEFLEFVQYMPNGWHRQSAGKFLSDRRVSTKLLHAGVIITDFEAARHFYMDQLGFTAGLQPPKPGAESKPVQVPFGHHIAIRMPGPSGDYLEIGNAKKPPEGRWVGVYAHVSLAVPDIDAAYKLVLERGPTEKPPHDRWLDLYDPQGSRVELTAPKPTGK